MKIAACGNWVWQKDTDPSVLLPWFAGGQINGGTEIKRNARRAVYLVTAEDGRRFYAKLEHSGCLLFRNKAQIEFNAGKMLLAAGIPCVRFVACGRSGLHQTLLVSAAEENVVDSREYFFATAACDPVKRQAFLAALATLLQKMQEQGIRHRDFHGGNVLVREVENGSCSLLLVDPVAVSREKHADPFELARILNDYRPLLTDAEALALSGNDPELLERIVADLKEKCSHEWAKRKAQILTGNSKFSRTVRLDDGQIFEIASTPWYKPVEMPADLSGFTVETFSAAEAEERWLAMFRARLEGRHAPCDYLLREVCGNEVRLYSKPGKMHERA